jgi:hypothetical protein
MAEKDSLAPADSSCETRRPTMKPAALTYRVPSGAMAPTLRLGEYVTVSLDAN